ncbi:cytochrome P450 87A3 [Quercus suber]|uniref:cytochrome P450 87A3 n=1 Tax=Quercus suber TaxID=58331 RepID=UPI000CE1F426|nr:cytochrome P450 87A3-like [Quercus suber]POF10009.1 cytochrome p450 87a3 [Quercus suber]
MWSVWLSVASLLIVIATHWLYRWRNPKCNGKLPPGSMGFPLIGETLGLLASSKSIDTPPFIKNRMKKYGPIFRTSLAGRPVVVSSDPEFNYYVFQQEGKLVERWYMDSFAKILHQDAARINAHKNVHKYLRNVILGHFGPEALKDKMLPQLEDAINKRLHGWSKLPSLEVKSSTSAMIFDFTAKQLFSFQADKSKEDICESFTNFLQGLMSFPINIPGTAYHRCLQNQKKAISIITSELEERKSNPEIRKGDFLDQILADMKTETFLTDKFVIYMMFGLLFASFETISSTLTLAIMLINENPKVIQELTEEHEAILKNREDVNSGLTWKEYKSMTFTHNVINESLRLASVAPGILRRTLQDIQVNGYTIPKGWALMVVPAALQLNPSTYEDPLTFNPWRWQNISANVSAKNFIPFGAGMTSCAGAEFSKVLMGVFFHILFTKYRMTTIKEGEVIRSPALGFGDGFHIQFSAKLG